MTDDGGFTPDAGFRSVPVENGLPCLTQSAMGVFWVHSGGGNAARMATIVPVTLDAGTVSTGPSRFVPRPAGLLSPYFPQCLNERSWPQQAPHSLTLLTAGDSTVGQSGDVTGPDGGSIFALELVPDGG